MLLVEMYSAEIIEVREILWAGVLLTLSAV